MIQSVDQSKGIVISIKNSLRTQFIDQLKKQINLSSYLEIGSKEEYIFIVICYLYFKDDFENFVKF